MQINEIEKLKKSDYVGGSGDLLDVNPTKHQPLIAIKNKSGYYYQILKEYKDEISITIYYYDKSSKLIDPRSRLLLKQQSNINLVDSSSKLFQSISITTHEDYVGQGLASMTYLIALSQGWTILSDSVQTPGGIALWVKLNSMPSVKVFGIVRLTNIQSDDPEILPRKTEQLTTMLKKIQRLGVKLWAQDENNNYYQFPVVVHGKRLSPLVGRVLSMYNNSDWSVYETLLIARMTK